MTAPRDHEAMIREIVEALAIEGRDSTIYERGDAFFILANRFTGTHPQPVAVRAAGYSRMAAQRIGAAVLPATDGEAAYLREQVGDGIVLLGFDRLHLVWLAHGLLIDLANAHDWNDHGTLLRPYAVPAPAARTAWTITSLRYGVQIVYEHLENAIIPIAPSLNARELAWRVTNQLRAAHRQRRAA